MANQVVKAARFAPGKCAISGDTTGPFLDTGKSVRGYGRIYLSFRFLDEQLRNAGYIKQEEVSELREHNDSLQEQNEKLQEKAEDFDALVASVSEHLPTPEPKVQEVTVTKERTPTDDEIARWIEKSGGNHPVVRRAKAPEQGSTEEWERLYGHRRDRPGKTRKEHKQEILDDMSGTENTATTPEEDPSATFELHEQNIDLDEVLGQNVSDIQAYAEGKGEDFAAALVTREYHLAEKNNRKVRKGVLAPLGYWDEEDDEPLIPASGDDDTDDEDE